MSIEDIATLPTPPHMAHKTKRLRENAPKYIASVIANSSAFDGIKGLDDLKTKAVRPLAGGMMSANYLVEIPGRPAVVIKLLYDGADAEAEALHFWQTSGANVVTVLQHGIVPSTKRTKHHIKYLIMEAVLDKDGQPAPTCDNYVVEHPTAIRRIGYLLGQELATMHARTSHRTFGDFADLPQAAPYKSWNAYLEGYIDMHYKYLLSIGIAAADLEKLRSVVMHTRFAAHGCYVHGDYSLRNSMIEKTRPLTIAIFDPNPVIGDPSWDLAVLYNNYHFAKRRVELAPDHKRYVATYKLERSTLRSFVKGYEATTGAEINMRHVILSQIMQTMFLAQTEEDKRAANRKKHKHAALELEVQVRRDNLIQKMYLLTHMRANAYLRKLNNANEQELLKNLY